MFKSTLPTKTYSMVWIFGFESCKPDCEPAVPEEAAEDAALAQILGVAVGEAAGEAVSAAAGPAVAATPAHAVLPLLRHVSITLLFMSLVDEVGLLQSVPTVLRPKVVLYLSLHVCIHTPLSA